MISASDLLHLPCSRDLIEGGIAYALHSLSHSFHGGGNSPYDRLRRAVGNAAVELAFRRYLSEHNIPFEVKAARPFTDPHHYDVVLGGRRCEIKSYLISYGQQISEIEREPGLVLKAPALVASDLHAGEGQSPRDLYLFAFLTGRVTTSWQDLQIMIEARHPYCLVHVMPEAWNRPSTWGPVGTLMLKSESAETQTVELGGQDEGREMRSIAVDLPPRTRVEVPNRFFSLSYVRVKSSSPARMGIYSPIRKETYLIGTQGWGNIWVYGSEILLAGYLSREEFGRRASFLPTGSRVFQYNQTQVKNLALTVSELRPLSGLLERVKIASVTGA